MSKEEVFIFVQNLFKTPLGTHLNKSITFSMGILILFTQINIGGRLKRNVRKENVCFKLEPYYLGIEIESKIRV